MEYNSIQPRIPNNLRSRVVACISKSLQDDVTRYLKEFQPDTKNALPHMIGDMINTNVQNDLTGEFVDIIPFKRYAWTGKIIIDRGNRITYSVLREKRLSQIRKTKRDRPHYLQSAVSVLNKNFKATVKQMSFFGEGTYTFDNETLEKDCATIFAGRIEKDDFIHCAILYNTSRGELTDAKIVFLDKDLDEIEAISLNEFIKPDFAALTNTPTPTDDIGAPESKTSSRLISVRNTVNQTIDSGDSATSHVRVREYENQA